MIVSSKGIRDLYSCRSHGRQNQATIINLILTGLHTVIERKGKYNTTALPITSTKKIQWTDPEPESITTSALQLYVQMMNRQRKLWVMKNEVIKQLNLNLQLEQKLQLQMKPQIYFQVLKRELVQVDV